MQCRLKNFRPESLYIGQKVWRYAYPYPGKIVEIFLFENKQEQSCKVKIFWEYLSEPNDYETVILSECASEIILPEIKPLKQLPVSEIRVGKHVISFESVEKNSISDSGTILGVKLDKNNKLTIIFKWNSGFSNNYAQKDCRNIFFKL